MSLFYPSRGLPPAEGVDVNDCDAVCSHADAVIADHAAWVKHFNAFCAEIGISDRGGPIRFEADALLFYPPQWWGGS